MQLQKKIVMLGMALSLVTGSLFVTYMLSYSPLSFGAKAVSNPISDPISDPVSDPISEPISGPISQPINCLTPMPTFCPRNEPLFQYIIIDNSDPRFTSTGNWSSSSLGTGFYGSDYLLRPLGSNLNASARWTPTSLDGQFKVFVNFVSFPNSATNANYQITYSGGLASNVVNQRLSGGSWIYLGQYTFSSGTSHYVEIHTGTANGSIVADSVLFQEVF